MVNVLRVAPIAVPTVTSLLPLKLKAPPISPVVHVGNGLPASVPLRPAEPESAADVLERTVVERPVIGRRDDLQRRRAADAAGRGGDRRHGRDRCRGRIEAGTADRARARGGRNRPGDGRLRSHCRAGRTGRRYRGRKVAWYRSGSRAAAFGMTATLVAVWLTVTLVRARWSRKARPHR